MLVASQPVMITANFHCYNSVSGLSGTGDDDHVWRHCGQSMADSNTYPDLTLVSCGISPKDATEDVDGVEFEITSSGRRQCRAFNSAHSAGVYAHARCCDFTPLGNAECTLLVIGPVSGDDNQESASCAQSSHPYMTGCSAHSLWPTYDGAFQGTVNPHFTQRVSNSDYSYDNASCTVAAGSNDAVSAYAVCCDIPDHALECVLRYSAPCSGSTPCVASTFCDAEYSMFGCSGYGAYRTVNAWYIAENAGTDYCYATSQNDATVFAVASCCRLETDAPTQSPTDVPTQSPTDAPTQSPNDAPTQYPTDAPTPYVNSTASSAAIEEKRVLVLTYVLIGLIVFVVGGLSLIAVMWCIKKKRRMSHKDQEETTTDQHLLPTSESNVPDTHEMKEANRLLMEWSLQQYANVLIEENGYDDVQLWQDLTVGDLLRMGFKEGHAKKFVQNVIEAIQSKET